MQALVPDKVLGRVASIDLLGSLALLPLGFLLTGYLAELYTVGQVALWYGSGTVLLALAGLLVPAVRGPSNQLPFPSTLKTAFLKTAFEPASTRTTCDDSRSFFWKATASLPRRPDLHRRVAPKRL